MRLIEKEGVPAPAPIEQRWTSSSSANMSPAHASASPETVRLLQYLPNVFSLEADLGFVGAQLGWMRGMLWPILPNSCCHLSRRACVSEAFLLGRYHNVPPCRRFGCSEPGYRRVPGIPGPLQDPALGQVHMLFLFARYPVNKYV